MERVFGVPVGVMTVALVVIVGIVMALIAAMAVRNRVFFRLGTRNVARRKARSALIVAGLMLATAIIASALATGDTMGFTIRSTVLRALGEIDETVSVEGADVDAAFVGTSAIRPTTFDEALFADVRAAALAVPEVDAVAPAIMEPVAVQNLTQRQTEPRVSLFATDPAHFEGFSEIRAQGQTLSLADLPSGSVYLTEEGAEELAATAGDRLRVFAGAANVEVEVARVVSFHGAGEDGPALLAPLSDAQTLLGLEGQIEHVLISNTGDELSGASRTDAVVEALAPVLAPLGLEINPTKQDGLDAADEAGTTFMTLFSTFGTFSIVAGILLIFLIFVMLAAERRSEMGIARAVGTQRGHLVQMFLFEGAVYDVLAAAVGAVLGLGVAYVMVELVAGAFASEDITIEHHLRASSLVIAWGLGMLLTLVVVAVSAWRVSVLDVVAAIRNLPTPIARKVRGTRWLRASLVIALGAVLVMAGAGSKQATAFQLGVSLVLVGIVSLARTFGLPDRIAYTLGGIALVVWWLLPFAVTNALVSDLEYDFSVWVVGGVLIVLGATWTVMYNADLVLGALHRVAGRIPPLAPIARMAVAYPLRSRGRTGMTLAMFMLVVFTLVTGTTISGSFIESFDDAESFGGGFDVRAVAAPAAPVEDLQAEGLVALGQQSFVPMEAQQVGTEASPEDYPVRGLDPGFLTATTYELSTRAAGYESDEEVWRAMAEQPGLAVVDSFAVPRRNAFSFGPPPDFQLEGFFVEDQGFAPVPVEVTDPATDLPLKLSVIGVLSDNAPFEMAGLSTSQATLEPLGAKARPTTYWLALDDGVDPRATAAALESAYLENGMEAEAVQEALDEAVSASWTVNRLIQGFMGLGLVVGVVALGVISARAVVERRQQIGVLRAIGFQPGMVRLSFLAEASFVSLTAIVFGTGLGLILSYNVVDEIGSSQGVAFAVPWASLGIVFAVVYLAAMASTLLPAIKGSRIYPAEALRYE